MPIHARQEHQKRIAKEAGRCAQMQRLAADTMDSLKLGLIGLPEPEKVLITTIFRLNRVDPSFIWTLAEHGPFDAVLMDSRASADAPGVSGAGSVRVCRLMAVGEAAQADSDMQRPLRSDLLVAWLNAIEVQILHGGGDGFASTTRSWNKSSAWPSAVNKLRSRPGPRRTFPAELHHKRFRLKKWPSPTLLASDVVRIRAATMLSRRQMTLRELSDLARMPQERCERFVQDLAEAGLLDMIDVVASQAQVTAPPTSSPALPGTSQVRAGFGRALIAGIRRRFGLG